MDLKKEVVGKPGNTGVGVEGRDMTYVVKLALIPTKKTFFFSFGKEQNEPCSGKRGLKEKTQQKYRLKSACAVPGRNILFFVPLPA